MITQLVSLETATAAVPDTDRDLIWIVEGDDPGLSSVEPASGTLTRHTDLPFAPTGVALSGDGADLLIAGADGTIATVAADDPGGGAGAPLATVPAEVLGQASATRPLTGRGSALVVSESQSRLLAAALSDGQIRTVIQLAGLTGVTASSSEVWVAATTAGEGRLYQVRAGTAQSVATGLLPTGHVNSTFDHAMLIAAHPTADRVSVLDFSDGSVVTYATDDLPGEVVEMHGLADGRFAILTRYGLAIADGLSDLERRPLLVPPKDPLFVGSWVRLQYDLSGTTLGPDDVSFVVADGPEVGIVSHTTVQAGLGGQKVPLLIAGGLLGTFRLEMIEAATGDVLGSTEFEVTDHWRDPDFGPSRVYMGDDSAPAQAGDWGGGPGSPQNMSTRPHNGTWRVAILLVNTTDGSYPTDAAGLAAARKAILDEVQDGVTFNGATRSARHYYEELSGWNATTNRGLTIRAHGNQVYGPVNLPEGWGTYFAQKMDPATGAVIDAHWSSRGATVQTVITRAITAGILTTGDFSSIDVLLIVPFSPDTTAGPPARRFVWPHANDATPFLAGTNMATDQRSFGFVFVPPDFAVHDGRQVHTTLAHEIGHTLGLPDLYNFPSYAPDVTNRLTGGWDLMAGSRDTLPHYSLSNRMRQGWISGGHLKLFNFAGSASPQVNESVTLHAAELGAPPAPRVRGIEIRLSDGWNTYVEYRAKQPAQGSDTLPTDRRVVVTDVTSESFVAPISRPAIVFVHNDADGDGPILGTSADYEDKDPGTQKTLEVKVVSTAADNAVVTVKYGSNGKPDPGIRPWTGPPRWQSEDIEVRNAKTMADPGQWFNTPWLGNLNTVVAKVRNNGDLLATGVVVDFFVIAFGAGPAPGPMVGLGSDTKDIAPGATVEFSTQWSPPATGPHYCIVVRLRLYQDPVLPGVFETNIYNNEAQSNYTKFVSATSSPSTRVGVDVELVNPFDASTLVTAVVRQQHPFHRVYLEHQWLRVEGRSSRPVRIFDEALAGFPEEAELGSERVLSMLWKEPNLVSVDGWAARPFEADCGALTLTGGAAIAVGAGRATVVRIEHASSSSASGTVEHLDDGSPCQAGMVVVVVREVDRFGEQMTAEGEVHQGRFVMEFGGTLPAERQTAEAHYLGSFGAAPSESEVVEVQS